MINDIEDDTFINKEKLNEIQPDGTKLSDIVEVSENNPLDENSVDFFFMDFDEEETETENE